MRSQQDGDRQPFGGTASWVLPMIRAKAAMIMGSFLGALKDFAELMAMAGEVPALPTQLRELAQTGKSLIAWRKARSRDAQICPLARDCVFALVAVPHYAGL
jgi:hypothetical protein